MMEYLLYDPTGSVDKLFPLPHKCEKVPDKIVNAENVILVEDTNLDRLLSANKGKVKAVFVGNQKTIADFERLKQQVEYILEMPPEEEEVEALCQVLEGNFLKSDVDMSDSLPPELLKKYQQSIFEKLKEVEAIIQNIEKNPSKELLVELRNSVHKFAGNAVSYGYVAATPLCRAHEAFLQSCYESIPKDKVIDLNKKFLRKFRLTMQKLNPTPISC